jgi:hypothetical protein
MSNPATRIYNIQSPSMNRGAQRAYNTISYMPQSSFSSQSAAGNGYGYGTTADVTFQQTGSLRDFDNAQYDYRRYGIGYLGNPFNRYPALNNPYTYPYGVSPTVSTYYRGAPGECNYPTAIMGNFGQCTRC